MADGEEVDLAQMKASDFFSVQFSGLISGDLTVFNTLWSLLTHCYIMRWDDCGGPCLVHRLHAGREVEKLSHHTFQPKLLKVDSLSL